MAMRPGLPGYEMESPLGTGSLGVVWRARQRRAGGRTVVIKRLPVGSDERRARAVLDAAERVAALDHPHLVRLLDVVRDGEELALVWSWAPGGSLADRLLGSWRAPADQVAAIGAHLADAAGAAHAANLAHGAIKPSDVVFSADGEPLLADLGVAAWAQVPTDAESGAAYRDPAVLGGAAPDALTDIYGIGAVCWAALAGRPPYVGTARQPVVDAVAAGRCAPLIEAAPDTPPALVDVVEAAMARLPGDRPSTAAALAAALRTATSQAVHVASVLTAGTEPAAAAPATPVWVAPTPAPADAPSAAASAPPAAQTPSPGRRARVLAVVAAAAVPLVALLALGAVRAGARADADATGAGVTAAADSGGASCSVPVPGGVAVAEDAGDAAVQRADVDGDGCPDEVTWRGNVAEVTLAAGGTRRAELGESGDVLVVGDWSCRGSASPGLYRPATGEVFLFDRWASADEPVVDTTARESGVLDGTPRVRDTDGDGCDEIDVARGRPA